MKTGLVLEGGGMRGLFTAGVIDVLQNDILCITNNSSLCNKRNVLATLSLSDRKLLSTSDV